MKFILGLLTGLVLDSVGTIAYSIQSGRDLREAVDGIRTDLENRDMDAITARLEAGFSQMQAQLEEGITQARDRAMAAAGEAEVVAEVALEEAEVALAEANEAVAEAAEAGANDEEPKPEG
jgi:hypothetical protein